MLVNETSPRTAHFREAIAGFIEARRAARDPHATDPKYEYSTWLADAARRVGQIQAVTHILKATHPDARGSSVHIAPKHLPQHAEIGSHSLGDDYAEDVVGNAAALDVYKFLKVEVEGKRLIDWLHAGDDDLRAALDPDAELADQWTRAFAGLVRSPTQATSHPLAKQIYWLVGTDPHQDDQYHLLQPMFSSSLAQAVHADIQDARFGETNKEARQAFRDKAPYPTPYRDYRNLVARKLGGTKPQNISQLNSERGGVNYLLPSLPPSVWQQRATDLRKRDTALDEFVWFEDVRQQVKALTDFLVLVQDHPSTDDIRRKRDKIVEALAELFALFGATIRSQHPAGWTRDESCRLPRCEQLWLDPERIELPNRDDPEHPEWLEDDQAFIQDYAWGDWPDQVAARFGNWLNGRLRDSGLVSVSLPESNHWARRTILDVAWPVPLQRRGQGGGQ